jgi:hypothetical protein
MNNQQVSNPPSTAYYLTIIGGILGLLLGVVLLIILVGVWLIIANALMIVYAQRLMAQPEEHTKYGGYILVFSILSLNLITLVGGILALVYDSAPPAGAQPYSYSPPTQPYQPQTPTTQYATTKYCPQCGNPIGGEALYCPKCGPKFPP